jgi:small-conductance mechanosensitive channel
MRQLLQQVASLSTTARIGAAVVGILIIYTAVRLLEKTLPRHFGQANDRYHARKRVVFVGYVTALLFLVILFEDHLGRLSLALGVAGAGLVVALQDVIAGFAGWVAITFSRLYTVGDRIQIGDTKGDVIDVSVLRTTLMETGNWVSGDLYNGRIVRIPNGFVLKGPVFNSSQGFSFVWDEIIVPFTAESDHIAAKEMLQRVVIEAVAKFLVDAEKAWKRVTDDYEIEKPGLEPIVALAVNSGRLEFTVSYIVDYRERIVVKDWLFTKIAEEILKSDGRLEWASTSRSPVKQSAVV